jgi:ABC-type multidrug transport system permease subunit
MVEDLEIQDEKTDFHSRLVFYLVVFSNLVIILVLVIYSMISHTSFFHNTEMFIGSVLLLPLSLFFLIASGTSMQVSYPLLFLVSLIYHFGMAYLYTLAAKYHKKDKEDRYAMVVKALYFLVFLFTFFSVLDVLI